MKNRNRIRRCIALMSLVCILTVQTSFVSMAEEAVGAVMRLAGTEGEVTVESQNGRAIELRESMKLYSGNTVKTEKASYAYVSLDDTKAVKLDAMSEAQVRKSGKKLELLLESGNLFFYAKAPLAGDEQLNVRTSTMVTGIRGTAGYVEVLDGNETRVSILEGSVTSRAYDAADGQLKDITILAGQKATFRIREGDNRLEIVTETITEEDVLGFVALEIKKDAELQRKITEATSLDVPLIIGKADEILLGDEAKTDAVLGRIGEELRHQENSKRTDPVFVDTSTDSSDSSNSSNPLPTDPMPTDPLPTDPIPTAPLPTDPIPTDPTPTDPIPTDPLPTDPSPTDPLPTDPVIPETVTRQMPVTASELNSLLAVSSVILEAGTGSNILLLDTDVQVPAEKQLTLESGVILTVDTGTVFTVDGTLQTEELVTNRGAIRNTSADTFRANNSVTNLPTGIIDNAGRFLVAGDLENQGTLDNKAQLEVSGSIRNLSGSMTISGSTEGSVESAASLTMTGGSIRSVDQSAGVFTLSGGIVSDGITVGENAALHMTGGDVYSGGKDTGISSLGQTVLRGGTIYGENVFAVTAGEGTLELNGTELKAKKWNEFLNLSGAVIFTYENLEPTEIGDYQFNYLYDGTEYTAGGFFRSLSEALQGAKAGETVTLISEETLASDTLQFDITRGEDSEPVVLDLNGYRVKLSAVIIIGDADNEIPSAFTVRDSAGGGSLEADDVEMFRIIHGSKLNLEDVTIVQNTNHTIAVTDTGKNTMNITNSPINIGADASFLYAAGETVVTANTSEISNTYSSYSAVPMVELTENATIILEDSSLIQGDGKNVSMQENTVLSICGNSRIENDSASEAAITRYDDVEIEFNGGTICNHGGYVFQDSGEYGLPAKEFMNTVIMGRTSGLFRAAQAYTPTGYAEIEKSDTYCYLIPDPRAVRQSRAIATPAEAEDARLSTPSNASPDNLEAETDNETPDMEDVELENTMLMNQPFLVPEQQEWDEEDM